MMQTQLFRYPKLEVLLAIASFFSFALYFHLKKWRSSSLPVNWPIVGMLPDIYFQFHRLHDHLVNILCQVGNNFMFQGPWFLGMNFLITCDPANVNHIYNAHSSNYSKGDDFKEIFDILGDGILSSTSESWRVQRRMAHAILGDRSFQSFVADAVLRSIQHGLIPFLDRMSEHGVAIDIHDVLVRLFMDISRKTVLGVDPDSLSTTFQDDDFFVALLQVEEALMFRHVVPSYIWKLLRWLNVGEERKLATAREVLERFIFQQISEKRAVERHDVKTAPDMLTLYLNWPMLDDDINSDAYKSDKFLRDTAFTLVAAGSGTLAIALSWFFYLIAKHPRVEQKILQELEVLLPEEDKIGPGIPIFSCHLIQSIVYLQAAILETLRLFPSVPMDHKGALKDDVLPSGIKVRQGMRIIIPIYAMGRMKDLWGEDCMEFRPERWISKDGTLRHEPTNKFMAFSSGPRNCVGRKMALTQLKLVAAAIVYNFRFELIEGQDITPMNSVLLYMANGCMVRVKKRLIK
ncbi:alkane hydroxylase MAH1-like [Canna indica]|uniref:Alkane hydroxylase MAH1-like n=1 Tax=Canna indica TaxID=4628 RepID=A0AAQ3JZ29_9LILI|nr:alkane hydroxylase MAH1-like [Canna indica]